VRLFGFELRRTKAVPIPLQPVRESRGGWLGIIREAFAGSFQRDEELTADTVLAHHAVFACVTLISSDIGKLRPKLVERDTHGIWEERESSSFSPVLRQPNNYQNHIQFKEWWITCKLLNGNSYALKQRDDRRVVTHLYLLDPARVQVLVATNGDVYYRLNQDFLSGLDEPQVTVPASEIIHDRMNCLFHPLVGVSPIYAAGQAAGVGLRIQQNSSRFFGQGSNPSGILTAPEEISPDEAENLQKQWTANFSGTNSGRVAVLGNNLKFEPLRMSAVDSQTIQQLRYSAETVCSTFHVPAFKVGVGVQPTYQNAAIMNQIYYSDCLQSHIESFEAVMDEGLGLTEKKEGKTLGVELDLDALLRMDEAAQYDTYGKGVASGILAPNEGRKKLNLKPAKGGDTPYLQQQNYSLAALDRRDQAAPAPSDTPTPTPTPTPEPEPDEESETEKEIQREIQEQIQVERTVDLFRSILRRAA
jgi:HK97 family phage portal protein